MLIATTLVAAALLASSAIEDAAPAARPAPSLAVAVTVDPALPPPVVSRILAEASAIWRPAGVSFAWRRDPHAPAPLHVTIGRSVGRPAEDALPLAWIVFDEDAAPEPDIYVSYANVLSLLAHSPGVVGRLDDMPRAQVQTLLGRALGRALAHEIGHYLLASKVHTPSGLMQTRRTAAEMFATATAQFEIDAGQRQRIATRVAQLMLAQRVTGDAGSEGL